VRTNFWSSLLFDLLSGASCFWWKKHFSSMVPWQDVVVGQKARLGWPSIFWSTINSASVGRWVLGTLQVCNYSFGVFFWQVVGERISVEALH
jgi:hypothetical protein